ncbi:type II toxin-antitoxin system VapC family toxin [Boseaceae bacterium BT-24-1]|nr:type II toxin-antitoxin system VapC family toxin [Boseaceae bacterium BT-24-1]
MTADTIVVDSSAIVAILLEEPEARSFLEQLSFSPRNICSAMSFVECVMVLSTRAPGLSLERFTQSLSDFAIDITPVDPAQASIAAQAFLRFGKGRHPAKLNLGDCFSYALAKSLNAPLLYKGEDFGRTDIVSAVAQDARP